MLCCDALCYVMMCYVMFCYVMLWCVMFCYDLLCYVMLWCVMFCCDVLCYVVMCVFVCAYCIEMALSTVNQYTIRMMLLIFFWHNLNSITNANFALWKFNVLSKGILVLRFYDYKIQHLIILPTFCLSNRHRNKGYEWMLYTNTDG